MRDYIYFGPTPCDEDCAQVGQDNFREQAKKEMNAYMNQLYRQFPELENSGVYLKILWQNHDFGTYGEVVAVYDDENSESLELALKIENNLPENWDEEALKELSENVSN